MNIDKFEEAIMNCRFCFMCRHLSTIGQARSTEVDTPRVRAAMLYGIRTGTNSFDDADFVDAMYRCDLSGSCRRNCVNGYDEVGLALAARADIVEQGKAPEKVAKLAKKLMKSEFTVSGAFRRNAPTGDAAVRGCNSPNCTGADNSRGCNSPNCTGADNSRGCNSPNCTGADNSRGCNSPNCTTKTALFLDATTASDKDEVAALKKLMAKAAGDCAVVTGGAIGKALKVLGYLPEAKQAAEKFVQFLNDAGFAEIVCPNPAAYDFLVEDVPAFGLKLKAKPYCTAKYLLEKKVKFAKKAGALYYLADDFMRNYLKCECPEKLLKVLKADVKMFGTNDEESYNCGEGAIVLDKLEPALVKDLAQYVAARADDPKKDQIVTLGVYAKTQLKKYGKLRVKTLAEVAAACL